MNEVFLNEMKDLLQDRYPLFLESCGQPAFRGFRVNPLKISDQDFFDVCRLPHRKSPFCEHGYYLLNQDPVARIPAYKSGLFYMQEPSAGAVAEQIGIRPGMLVLDLCAAPGSKSTQLGELLKGEGLLVSNEIHTGRSRILQENIIRHGITNCIVLNCDTLRIADQFEGVFDAVLCDAPCSGEGMFRKDPDAAAEWSPDSPEHCAIRQYHILENARRCLKPGGILMYSTCTFNRKENEETILRFLDANSDMELTPVSLTAGSEGVGPDPRTKLMHRIFPMDGGEGHFMARMIRKGEGSGNSPQFLKSDRIPDYVRKEIEDLIGCQYPYYRLINQKVYGGTHPFIDTGKLHVTASQVFIGEIRNNRFEFSHHFFTSTYKPFLRTIVLSENEVTAYLHGEAISSVQKKGWYAVSFRGFVPGGVKSDGNSLKNKYPKSLRTR